MSKSTLDRIEEGDLTEIPGPPIPAAQLPPEGLLVTDYRPLRLHRPEDLMSTLLYLLAIAVVLGLGLQAAAIDTGVTEEVRSVFGSQFRNLLLIPLRFAEGVFLLVSPAAVLISLVRRGRFNVIAESVGAGVVAGLLILGIRLLLPHMPEVFTTVLQGPGGGFVSGPNIGLGAIIAALTMAGTGSSNRVLRYSWIGIWFLLVLDVLQGNGTVTTMLLTLLVGRLIGSLARWILGFDDRRASPTELVQAVLDVGITPAVIHRVDDGATVGPLQFWRVTEVTDNPEITYGDTRLPLVATLEPTPEDAAKALGVRRSPAAAGVDRRYQLDTTDGNTLDLDVLDPQRGLASTAAGIWEYFRLGRFARWVSTSVKMNAERAIVTTRTAIDAGVRAGEPLALSEASGSIALVWKPLPHTVPLLEWDRDVTEEMLDSAWEQLGAAHRRGIAHRNLDLGRIRVDEDDKIWIVGWDDGDLGSSSVNRQIDCAQMLTYLALVVGPERALASAQRHLSAPQLAAVAMATQTVIIPADLRKHGAKPALLKELRSGLAQTANTSEEELEPFKLQRFSVKAVLISVIVVIVLVVLLGSLNIESIGAALKDANPWWILAAFGLGVTPWLGSAMSLQAFSSVKLRLWDAVLAQVAASFVGVAAPAGIGPAGLNLRFLTRQGMKMPVAVATVTLLQIYHFLTTILLLLLVVVVSGTSLGAFSTDTMTIVWIVAAVVGLVAALIAVPAIRKWVWKKVSPIWTQVAPQLTRVLANPKQMIYAFLGILVVNGGYIGAFGASLAAFGQHLDVGSLSTTYLLSNTAGSVVPTPGGIGPVEAALTAGLTVAGISAAIALSASVVFRLVTFYMQMPIGWAALKVMQRRSLV